MEPDDEHGHGNEESFWIELDSLLAQECSNHSAIDDTLRSYLSLIARSRGNVVQSDRELSLCAYKLATSPLFGQQADYIRHQFVYSLLQEDDSGTLLGTTSFLLADARTTERTFEILNEAGAFTRLVDLIGSTRDDDDEDGLNRLLMELLYEMARIQKISLNELGFVHDDFVCRLFDMIEQVSHDISDPYHYHIIRVLLVLNEQFMVAAHHPSSAKSTVALTNRVVKVLSVHGSKYKTFGENIILLLNREDETSLQLLTLKLLYLLFTTPSTYEYFYTNDLRVLVDILIRNLLDLPEEAAALRHTYLRVLYPLLKHTQLQHPPHYKQAEIRKLLTIIGGGRILEEHEDGTTLRSWAYFEEIDDTTKRLVQRCQAVDWLAESDAGPSPAEPADSAVPDEAGSEPASPVSPSKPHPPAVPAPRKLTKRSLSKTSTLTVGQFLTPQLENARQSSLSMIEMAAQKEKPGVITPSRNQSFKHTICSDLVQKREKPPLPQARRSAGTRIKMERASRDVPVARREHPDQSPTTAKSPPGPKAEDAKAEQTASEQQAVAGKDAQSPQAPPQPKAQQASHDVPVHSKKPPPAPRARRWGRGKRLKEEDQAGKFDATLPSVNASKHDKSGADNHHQHSDHNHHHSHHHSHHDRDHLPSGSEQVDQVEKEQGLDGITPSLNRAHLEDEQQTRQPSDSPATSKNGTHTLDTIVERPAIVVEPARMADEPTQSSHQPASGPESLLSTELERSPFLSDAEVDEPSDGGDG